MKIWQWLLTVQSWPAWTVMAALLIVLSWQMVRGDALVCADGSIFAKRCIESPPFAFGSWEPKVVDKQDTATTDGFLVVNSYGGKDWEAESDFDILVGMKNGQLQSVARGGAYESATTPVPKGSDWIVKRGSNSNQGKMDVHWLPLRAKP